MSRPRLTDNSSRCAWEFLRVTLIANRKTFEMNDNTKVYAEILERLDRIERALPAYFASATINQASSHDRVNDAVINFGETLKNAAGRG